MWDLNPLIEQVKQFNHSQTLILQELKEIKKLLETNAINSKAAK